MSTKLQDIDSETLRLMTDAQEELGAFLQLHQPHGEITVSRHQAVCRRCLVLHLDATNERAKCRLYGSAKATFARFVDGKPHRGKHHQVAKSRLTKRTAKHAALDRFYKKLGLKRKPRGGGR